MKRFVIAAICLLAHSIAGGAGAPMNLFPSVEFQTSEGRFVVELDGRRAPITVANFLQYVQEGFYDGTVFHRVIPGFVAQAGGFDAKLSEKTTRKPIVNESGNGLSNRRGTIAMARMAAPHTATAQFYINLSDNQKLDPNPSRWGYTVFGMVTEGLEVLDQIAMLPTGRAGPFPSDVPQKSVVIEQARVLGENPAAGK